MGIKTAFVHLFGVQSTGFYDDFRTQLSNNGLTVKTEQLSRQNEQQTIAKISYLKQF